MSYMYTVNNMLNQSLIPFYCNAFTICIKNMTLYPSHCKCTDTCLLQNDLIDVVAAIELSRRTVRKIRMNFIWAVLYNSIGTHLTTH